MKLSGLDENKIYAIDGSEGTFYGDTLEKSGIIISNMNGDFISKLIHIREVEK